MTTTVNAATDIYTMEMYSEQVDDLGCLSTKNNETPCAARGLLILWIIPTRSWRRAYPALSALCPAALINSRNNGCALFGLLLNSG